MANLRTSLALTVMLATTLALAPGADAGFLGLLSYGMCQTGCNAVAVACYTAAGATFGTVTAGIGVPPPSLDAMLLWAHVWQHVLQ